MAVSMVRRLAGGIISSPRLLTNVSNLLPQARCISSSLNKAVTYKPNIQAPQQMGSSIISPLLQACLPFTNSVRTMVRYSFKRGKPKTVKSVVNRFYRLDWGIYIRTRAGRHKKKWKKPEWINERGKYHVFCNKTQSRMLDKMTTKYWKKKRHYVDDPYEPFQRRFYPDMYKPPKFLP